MDYIKRLIEISRYYGSDSEFVISGGGNTSFKDKANIWIKASGVSLAGIDKSGFVMLSRKLVREIADKEFPEESSSREKLIKDALISSIIIPEPVYYRRCIPPVSKDPGSQSPDSLRPSVETSLHEVFDHPYVVHTHPTVVNALLCSQKAEEKTRDLFGDDVLFIEYTDPGYTLFIKTMQRLDDYRKRFKKEPDIIFLQNHGMIVGADNVEKIRKLSDNVLKIIRECFTEALPDNTDQQVFSVSDNEVIKKLMKLKKLHFRSYTSKLVMHFVSDSSSFEKVSRPFTPDDIVYCKSSYLFTSKHKMERDMDLFHKQKGYYPRVIGIEDTTLLLCSDTESGSENALEVFLNLMKVSYLSESFGGPAFLSDKEIGFIDNWESEHYRLKISTKK